MTAVRRRTARSLVSAAFILATADDVDGTTDNTQALNVAGCSAILIVQHNNGTLGTAGIDVLEVSHDGGVSWAAAGDALALASDEFTGTILVAGALNAAGVEPVNMAVFKCGPYSGPTAIRIGRKTTTTSGTTWITGAPEVNAFCVGGNPAFLA